MSLVLRDKVGVVAAVAVRCAAAVASAVRLDDPLSLITATAHPLYLPAALAAAVVLALRIRQSRAPGGLA